MDRLKLEKYFATARERYQIMLRRRGDFAQPWTTDEVFKEWRFCNVHREDDKTTGWFRKEVREKLNQFLVLRATVIFRWFNRIETGEIIKDLLLHEWDTEEARRRLTDVSPIVTGAYMIKTVTGMNKLDGMLWAVDNALPKLRHLYDQWPSDVNLYQAWSDLKTIEYLGPFMAYEVVSDLRWTDLLCGANDIMLWANAGPGCTHGLGRLHGEGPVPERFFNRHSKEDQLFMQSMMHSIVMASKDPQFWPQNWMRWEMREAEHWACEFDKYERAEVGERMKRRYP